MPAIPLKHLWKYAAVSLLIGAVLWLLDFSGALVRFESLFYAADDLAARPFPPAATLAILLLLATFPGAAIAILGNEKGMVCGVGGLALYCAAAWGLWQGGGPLLPVAAPLAAVVTSVVRGLGWAAAFREMAAVPRAAPVLAEGGLYDAFISYRREGGAEVARLVREALAARGLRAFLDVDDLAASHFDDRLLSEIERAPNFILILSPEALAGCRDGRDWLRREVAHAIATKRNVIPILRDDFRFPDAAQLPDAIRDLPRYNAVLYSHVHFKSTIDKLVAFLK